MSSRPSTGLADHWDPHLFIWPHDRGLVEIKHLSPPAPRKRHTGFPKFSFFTVPGGLPAIQTHGQGEKDAVSGTRTLSTEAL